MTRERKMSTAHIVDSFITVYIFGMGNPLNEQAAENVYAPIFSNMIQSPMFRTGNNRFSTMTSKPSHVGPQMEQGITSHECDSCTHENRLFH